MKKNIMTYVILTAFLMLNMPNLGALAANDAESSPPEDINGLHVRTRSIDVDMQKAREVADASQVVAASAPEVEPQEAEFLTSDQIIDSVIKKENQNKTIDLDFDQTNWETFSI